MVVCCWVACMAQAQELWADTRAGMTPDEVVQLVPNAYRATQGPDFKAFDDWPGMTLQARVDHVEILGVSAYVLFGFIDNGLERVVLAFSSDGMSRSTHESQCRTFRAALNSRYGPEGSVSEDTSSLLGSDFELLEYLWFSGGTRVRLSCTFLGSASRDPVMILTIAYHHLGASGL